MIDNLLQVYIRAYEHFGLKDPEKAMDNCSEFAIACALLAKESNIEVFVILCKIRCNNTFDWYIEGEFYPHCLLKINGDYYDFTISQFNQNNNEYFIGASLPEYITDIVSPMIVEEESNECYNEFHKYMHELHKKQF